MSRLQVLIRGELRIDPCSYDRISNDETPGGMLSAISPKISLMREFSTSGMNYFSM